MPSPKPIQPPAYVFVVDTCVAEDELRACIASLSQALTTLPEYAQVQTCPFHIDKRRIARDTCMLESLGHDKPCRCLGRHLPAPEWRIKLKEVSCWFQVGLVTYGTHVHVHELGFSECAKSYVFQVLRPVQASA